MDDAKLHFARGPGRLSLLQMGPAPGHVIRVDYAGKECKVRLKLTGRIAGNPSARRREVKETPFRACPVFPVMGIVGNNAVFGFGDSQRLLQLLACRDVLIGPQNPFDPTLGIKQRHLIGTQPNPAAIGGGLGFFIAELRLPRGHHQVVIGSIKVCLFRPPHLEVVLADDFLGGLQPRIASKGAVAAQVGGMKIFPENPDWDGIQDGLQHLPPFL